MVKLRRTKVSEEEQKCHMSALVNPSICLVARAFPSPTIVGPDVSFPHSRQGGIRFNTVNMTSGTFPASGQYCSILSLGIVFVDTLPRDSIGQYCFSIPDNSWSRRVNISKQCNLVLTPCHSSTKGWDMDDDLSWHQSQWDSDFWHPS